MGSYNYYKMFGCFNRKFKISETEPPPDVREAFMRYSQRGTQMSVDQLLRFLIEYQGEEDRTLLDAEWIMQHVLSRRHHLAKYTRNGFCLDDFFYFLFQEDLNGPIKSEVHHDMTAPLQHYFIYTGHNSYLTGNQLSSDCSEIPIIKALERGVRGIELDLWPNSAKDNVHVLHGRTLTTPVPLLKCLKSIKEHAFVKSPYPVIITLEDHLTPYLQARVAEMVIQIFGEMLYYPESGHLEEFPSPEALKHRVILSTKPPKEYLESKQQKDRESPSPMGKDSSEEELSVKGISEFRAQVEAEERYSRSEIDDEGCDAFYQKSSHQASEPDEEDSEAGDKNISWLAADGEAWVQNSSQLSGRQDCGDGEVCNQKQEQLAAREYKRLIAIPPGTVEEESGAFNRKSSQPALDGEACHQKSSQASEPDYEDVEADLQNSNMLTAIEHKHLIDFPPGIVEEDSDACNKESSELAADGEACNQNLSQLISRPDYEDGEAGNERSPQLAAREYKRLIAIPPGTVELQSESDADDEDFDGGNQKSSQLAAPEYKRLIAIHAGKAKHGLRHALISGTDKVNRLSLSEQALEKAAASCGTDVVRFTQKNILRVFPKGTRVTSSNFKPMLGWMHGAQMVAFNMQGYGKSLWLMHGMFRSNGGCGYVKKPDFLMKMGPHNLFDPKVTLPVKKTLKVNIYLGDGWRLDFSHTHFDTYSPPDFYTKMYIVGVPADCAKKKTRIIEDDWGPIWDEEFTFPLTVPELALLRIEVREYDMSEKDDFGGQTCLPVSELRPGFRAVPLYDKKGQKLKSVRLFMRFRFV